MRAPAVHSAPSRARMLAHLAPAAAAWAYLLWIALDRWSPARLLESLFPLQLALAALGFLGGVWALWLPSRSLRIGVFVASLLGAMLLVGFRVIAERSVQ